MISSISIFTVISTILLYSKVLSQQLDYFLTGGITDSSFRIKSHSGTYKGSILIYLNSVQYATYSPDVYGYFDIQVNGLNPDTFYAVEIKDTQSVTLYNQNIKTFPSSPLVNQSLQPFSFIASSNAYTNTDSFVFDKIRKANPRFFMLLGNMHDDKKKTSDWKDYQQIYFKGNKDIINFI
jgi:hypothetical protein